MLVAWAEVVVRVALGAPDRWRGGYGDGARAWLRRSETEKMVKG